jgi:hypothetical protein
MTLLDMENGIRQDPWPDESCLGLSVLLPGGETGRLLRFEHETDPDRWIYTLEFSDAGE